MAAHIAQSEDEILVPRLSLLLKKTEKGARADRLTDFVSLTFFVSLSLQNVDFLPRTLWSDGGVFGWCKWYLPTIQ